MNIKNTYVRFENGQKDKIGQNLGPFEWVQITYCELRADDVDLAFQNKDGFWVLVSIDEPDQLWSDVIIYGRTNL